MTDPPRRWDDDSPEEDAEVHRALELDRLARWAQEQKTRPLRDALEAHGVIEGNPGGESWAGPLILPDWWDDVVLPVNPCPWCQRPVPASPCGECRAARDAAHDPPSLWAWWASLPPDRRRVQIAARFGTDPWSGRPVAIMAGWTEADRDGRIRSGCHRYLGAAPDGIYWGARRRG